MLTPCAVDSEAWTERGIYSPNIRILPPMERAGLICRRICAIDFKRSPNPFASRKRGTTGIITLSVAIRAFIVSKSSDGAQSTIM